MSDIAAGEETRRAVRGVVQVVTDEPMVLPAHRSALDRLRGRVAMEVEERPWLVAVAIAAFTGLLWLGRRRD